MHSYHTNSSAHNHRAMMAALYHYNMHSPDVMRWLGGTYTGAYRLNQNTVELLQQHDIDPFLIAQYIRATTVGCPNHFVAEVSRDNFLEYLGRGNHPSVARYVTEVMKGHLLCALICAPIAPIAPIL